MLLSVRVCPGTQSPKAAPVPPAGPPAEPDEPGTPLRGEFQ